MPVPTLISSLDPVAGNNSPAASETPKDGDDYLRVLSAFIAQLYDGSTSVSAGMVKSNGTALSAAVAGTDYLAPAAIGVTVQGYDADIPTEIISQADAEAGTQTTTKSWTSERVSQAVVARFASKVLATSGRQVLPGGLIIQWGVSGTSASADTAVTFSATFPNAVFVVIPGIKRAGGNGAFATTDNITTSGFGVGSWYSTTTRAALDVAWVAIGY